MAGGAATMVLVGWAGPFGVRDGAVLLMGVLLGLLVSRGALCGAWRRGCARRRGGAPQRPLASMRGADEDYKMVILVRADLNMVRGARDCMPRRVWRHVASFGSMWRHVEACGVMEKHVASWRRTGGS